jgi:hypothetical protein
MKKQISSRAGTSLVLVLLLLLGAANLAQSNDGQPGKIARTSWDPPVSGTPVHHYVVQIVELGGADADTTTYDNIADEFLDSMVFFGLTYKARVAAVDSLGRQGAFSFWSPIYGPREEY